MDRPANDLKAIFIAALDHGAGADRDAYLDAACGDNAELRRRVEALLAAHDRPDEVLGKAGEPLAESGAIEFNVALHEAGVSSSQASSTADYQEAAEPDVLIAGRYTLQHKIGERGMGEVWVAKQSEPVKRKVALKLWDLATGTELRTFTGYSGDVNNVAKAPDGRTALSGSEDTKLKLWDLATGKELRTFSGHSLGVSCIATAADGRTALSGSSDKTMKLWDLDTGKHLRTFTGHSRGVGSVAVAADGRTALTGSGDGTLKQWDLASGKALRTIFTGHTMGVRSAALAPNGRTALSAGFGTLKIKIWDLTTGKEVGTLNGHADSVLSAVAPLTLARCYWNLNRNDEARREFQIALEQSKDTAEQTYLGWCIQAIDTEPERKRQQGAIAAEWELRRRALRANSLAVAGMADEAVAAVAELTKNLSWDAGQWYDFACVYSLPSSKIADKKNEYADRAMELLRKSVIAGWNDAKHTTNDPDLAPLRNRDDFKKLLADREKNAAAQPKQ